MYKNKKKRKKIDNYDYGSFFFYLFGTLLRSHKSCLYNISIVNALVCTTTKK